MTILKLIAILELDGAVSVPSSISDLKITNEQDTCRFAEIAYFTSETFTKDVISILNELAEILNENLISINKFALCFTKQEDELLHLELTHCN